ncbi:asparagine synthase (glutamine-hydrolyzing), partial [Candidatus Woesearchaeota archaeon]|nr:asparagine synthase (glutamine-hydrolyzing) [Candidatus Woesearchaeota archaeon]
NWEDKNLIKHMNSSLIHRGPDGQGIYTNKNISLGHRRLSIIDLSNAGKQPMCNEDETIWITFNGEIYNHRDLRKILESKGHRFKSNTDTEVIIHGYEEWGEKVLEKLNGQFAFAIYNNNSKTLFLARDRIGIKPLYYYYNDNKFIFASEIKAILQHDIKREINKQAANDFINLRYMPSNETLFKNIYKINPGEFLTLKDNKLTKSLFWQLSYPKQEQIKPIKIKELLEDSIKKRLVADVPVGAYLSGGIDSAAIVAIAAKLKKEPIKTFTVGFDANNEVDELSKARIIANHCNTDHKEITIKESVSGLLPKLLWHLDVPHGDPVIIPQYKLSQEAVKKVKVVLSGEGADELFGGYVQYQTMLKGNKIKNILSPILKTAARLTPIKIFDKLYDYPSSIGSKGKEKIVDFLSHLKKTNQAYYDLISITSENDRKNLLKTNNFTKEITNNPIWQKNTDLITKMTSIDSTNWLQNYVLHINDRMTMTNSIEGRVPFLDHRLIELSRTIPAKQKINKQTKAILRQAIKPLLPKNVTKTKKQAFFMPLDKWYKEELKDMAKQLFTERNVKQRNIYNHYQLQKIWRDYNKSKLIYGKQLFTIINLELWQRMFIDNDTKKELNLKQIL